MPASLYRLIFSLNIHIGYENAARIVKKAYADNLTLKEAAFELNLLTEQQFDEWVVPTEMIRPLKRKL